MKNLPKKKFRTILNIGLLFYFFVPFIWAQETQPTISQSQNIKLEEIYTLENPDKYSVMPSQKKGGFKALIMSDHKLYSADDQKNNSIIKTFPPDEDVNPLPSGNFLVLKGIDEETSNIWFEDGSGNVLRDITKEDGVDLTSGWISAHDGSWLMLFDDNPKNIRTLVYDRDGNLINSNPSPVEGFSNSCVSKDNQLMGLVESGSNYFNLLDKSGNVVQKIQMDDIGADCKFSNDGKRVFFASRKSLYFMDLNSFKTSQIPIPQPDNGDLAIDEFPNGKLILVAGLKIFLFDTNKKNFNLISGNDGKYFGAVTPIGNYVAVSCSSRYLPRSTDVVQYYLIFINENGKTVFEQLLPVFAEKLKAINNYLFVKIEKTKKLTNGEFKIFRFSKNQ